MLQHHISNIWLNKGWKCSYSNTAATLQTQTQTGHRMQFNPIYCNTSLSLYMPPTWPECGLSTLCTFSIVIGLLKCEHSPLGCFSLSSVYPVLKQEPKRKRPLNPLFRLRFPVILSFVLNVMLSSVRSSYNMFLLFPFTLINNNVLLKAEKSSSCMSSL